MTDIPQVVVDCDRLSAAVQQLVDGVTPDQWTAPTPAIDRLAAFLGRQP